MLITSTVADGNMHPNLSSLAEAQENFNSFCVAGGVCSENVLGIRIDPGWVDGARIADLRTLKVNAGYRLGSVAVEDRISAHAVIMPLSLGAFVLSADCYPVALVGKTYQALLHVGWRSNRDMLLISTLDSIEATGDDLPHTVHIGPGVRSTERILESLVIMIHSRSPHSEISIDDRDTITSPELFSRRASAKGMKARGNHVCVLPVSSSLESLAVTSPRPLRMRQ